MTQCDINKDVKVGEGLQYAGIKVQVKHFDQLFRVYIKSVGKDTACRVEQSLSPKKPAIQALNEILNKNTQHQQPSSSSSSTYCQDDNARKITEIHDIVKSLLNLHKPSSAIVVEPHEHELAKGGGASL